ncbi:uncharacterized protein LOC134773075 [Penaeus indicus]|uniref:uncharacterized protein LOC134773075 n=1 Tax=Penaeus indicus TaxID=29960 RepID=UPI00300D0F30
MVNSQYRIQINDVNGGSASEVRIASSESTEEELDAFYDDIEQALKQCKSTDITIIQGDFNAKVGESLKSRYEALQGEPEVDWNSLKECLITAENETLPVKKQDQKSKTAEILELMETRRKAKVNNETEYKLTYKEIKKKCNEVKEKQLEGPPILQDEVRYVLKKMKHGQAPGPDKVTIEMFDALEEYGIDLITTLINNIYDTGHIPSDLLKSNFIALPKKAGAIECGLHRTINQISHLTKVLLRIVMLRARKIKPEIAEEQCGFVEGKGTTNALYILRTLSERALEVQQDLYLCFIDYTKALDIVNHETIMKILEDINLNGKDLRIIQNIEIIMRNIEGMPGAMVGGQNINNLRYADDTVLIVGNEEDLQSLVNTINEESEKWDQD